MTPTGQRVIANESLAQAGDVPFAHPKVPAQGADKMGSSYCPEGMNISNSNCMPAGSITYTSK